MRADAVNANGLFIFDNKGGGRIRSQNGPSRNRRFFQAKTSGYPFLSYFKTIYA